MLSEGVMSCCCSSMVLMQGIVRVRVCTNGWIDAWMDIRMDGCMYVRMDVWMCV